MLNFVHICVRQNVSHLLFFTASSEYWQMCRAILLPIFPKCFRPWGKPAPRGWRLNERRMDWRPFPPIRDTLWPNKRRMDWRPFPPNRDALWPNKRRMDWRPFSPIHDTLWPRERRMDWRPFLSIRNTVGPNEQRTDWRPFPPIRDIQWPNERRMDWRPFPPNRDALWPNKRRMDWMPFPPIRDSLWPNEWVPICGFLKLYEWKDELEAVPLFSRHSAFSSNLWHSVANWEDDELTDRLCMATSTVNERMMDW